MGNRMCYMCKKSDTVQGLVVCRPCFKKVMKNCTPVPALFAEWSKQDEGI